MKKRFNFSIIFAFLLLSACRSSEEVVLEETTPPAPVQPAPPPVNPFAATYQGNLPCPKCQDKNIVAILQLTAQQRYFLTIRQNNNERHFSGQYRVSADKRFIQLDNNADTLTFMLGKNYLEARLPDGSAGKRQFPDQRYQLQRQAPVPAPVLDDPAPPAPSKKTA